MLSTKEITKMCKGTKITSRVDLYKAKQSGSKSSQTGEQCCKISIVLSFSFAFFLQISTGSIMHLRIRLGFIVFESD